MPRTRMEDFQPLEAPDTHPPTPHPHPATLNPQPPNIFPSNSTLTAQQRSPAPCPSPRPDQEGLEGLKNLRLARLKTLELQDCRLRQLYARILSEP